jgi:hypothetical protein
MNENYETLVKLFDLVKIDYAKATEKNNKSAAKRVRVNSSRMMKLLKIFRKNVIDELYTKKED